MTVRSLLAVLAIGACAPKAARPSLTELRGARLTPALPKPELHLQNLDGSPFDFRKASRGTLTFLFFGYTNCPDVCPLQLSHLAWAIRRLPPQQAERVHLVFVTTDPARDTPERIRSWLAQFDSSFVGVTGTPAALEAAQRAVGMPPAFPEGELPQGGYGVTHAAQLWAFTPDDSAHVVYPGGTQREDLAADLRTLLHLRPTPP